MPTHEVKNQVPPLVGYNLFAGDVVLSEALQREGAAWAADAAEKLGAILGSDDTIGWGFDANSNPPVLHTHNSQGQRIDEVRFHPAWYALMDLSVTHGLHSLPWSEKRPGAHVARAALFFLASQNESGHGCPISMTYAAVPALRRQADVAKVWEPRIVSRQYDPRCLPADQKQGRLSAWP